ncbi:MAG: protein translocase SEC61 complex subunit gamma [Nanoarchaeota archaeon]|nr:protein translocase SEC61 complex subunit gamma [Nanoarchaeota archaeon]
MSASKSFSDMKRVWKVTKKPSKKDYFQTLKIVVIGLVIIGLIALVMEFLNQLVIKPIFS